VADVPDRVPGAGHRLRRTWLVLLLGAGAVTLIAGFVLGAVLRPRPGPASPGTATAGPRPAGQQAQFQVTRVRVTGRPGGARVRWGSPSRTAGVIAFIVVAELGGRAEQEHTVGSSGHGAVFAGLRTGRRYCFVVGTVVEPAGGRAETATAPDVCRVIR
jgi:hypothetical protein